MTNPLISLLTLAAAAIVPAWLLLQLIGWIEKGRRKKDHLAGADSGGEGNDGGGGDGD